MTDQAIHPLGSNSPRKILSTAEHKKRDGGKGDPRWFHVKGVDLMCPIEQPRMPVYAVQDGILSAKDGSPGNASRHDSFDYSDKPENAGWKLYLIMRDESEIYMYQHLSEIVVGLKPGSSVRRAQLIGYTGAQASGGPHLHFACKRGDTDAFIAGVPHE